MQLRYSEGSSQCVNMSHRWLHLPFQFLCEKIYLTFASLSSGQFVGTLRLQCGNAIKI